jgi:glycosyltransferase involved in cell wall biosynthesis
MVSPDFFPVWSGIGTYLIELVKNLPPSIKLHLVTVDRERIRGSRKTAIDNVKNGSLDEVKGKVTIHNITKAKGTFSYHLGFQAACLKTIPKLVREERIDLLHTNFPLMSDIFLDMTKIVKAPKVATIHSTIEGQHFGVQRANFGARNLEESDLANSLLYYPLRFGEKIVARNTKNFIAVSENIKNEFIHCMGIDCQRIRTIYNGVDVHHYCPEGKSEQVPGLVISKDRPIILFTGRLVATKGIDTVVRSMPKVISLFPKSFFLFVGGGSPNYYLRLARRLGVSSNNFCFYGYANYIDMPSIYSSCSIYVAPTLYEPLGIRILEAMSCAKPVVATKVGGITEIISHRENGILISPSNESALADSIIALLSDFSLAQTIGKSARKTVVDKFSSAKVALQTFDYFRSCV